MTYLRHSAAPCELTGYGCGQRASSAVHIVSGHQGTRYVGELLSIVEDINHDTYSVSRIEKVIIDKDTKQLGGIEYL